MKSVEQLCKDRRAEKFGPSADEKRSQTVKKTLRAKKKVLEATKLKLNNGSDPLYLLATLEQMSKLDKEFDRPLSCSTAIKYLKGKMK